MEMRVHAVPHSEVTLLNIIFKKCFELNCFLSIKFRNREFGAEFPVGSCFNRMGNGKPPPVQFALKFRLPEWLSAPPTIEVNSEE